MSDRAKVNIYTGGAGVAFVSAGDYYMADDTGSTQLTKPTDLVAPYEICYGNGVLVTSSYVLQYSNDEGSTWNVASTPPKGAESWDGVEGSAFLHDGTQFVMLGNVWYDSDSFVEIWTSTDGDTWAKRHRFADISNVGSFLSVKVNGIGFDGSNYIASIVTAFTTESTDRSFIYKSTDLTSWSLVMSNTNNDVNNVENFVFSLPDAGEVVWAWEQASGESDQGYYHLVAGAAERIVDLPTVFTGRLVIGAGGGTLVLANDPNIELSTDLGATATTVPYPAVSNFYPRKAVYAGGVCYVGTFGSAHYIARSQDGAAFTTTTTSDEVDDMTIKSGASGFALVEASQHYSDYSQADKESTFGGETDLWGAGITKEDLEAPEFSVVFDAEVGEGVIRADYLTLEVFYTLPVAGPDVDQAPFLPSPFTAALATTSPSGEVRHFVVGESGLIKYTDDYGVNWTTAESGVADTLWGITKKGDTYIAAGNSGTIITSTDGDTWAVQPSGTLSSLFSVNAEKTNGYVAAGCGDDIILRQRRNETAWAKVRPPRRIGA